MVLHTLAVILHVFVLIQGVAYFTTQKGGRDCDRHIVAGVSAGSALFLVSQFTTWHAGHVGPALHAAFSFFNGALYLSLIGAFRRDLHRRRPA